MYTYAFLSFRRFCRTSR